MNSQNNYVFETTFSYIYYSINLNEYSDTIERSLQSQFQAYH